MHDVRALYVYETVWENWGIYIIEVCVSLLVAAALACYRLVGGHKSLTEVFFFTPSHAVEHLYRWATVRMVLSSLVYLCVLLPIYIAGDNLFTCGSAWLNTTMAHLKNSPHAEWCCAIACCCYVACNTHFLATMSRSPLLLDHKLVSIEDTSPSGFYNEHMLCVAVTQACCQVPCCRKSECISAGRW